MTRLLARLRQACVVFVVALLLIHITPLVPWIAGRLADDWGEVRGDVLIVLGADLLGDGTLGVGSYWRSVYGLRAWRHGGFRRIVICGGRPEGRPTSIAAEMGRFLTAMGVPAGVIVLEESSNSTHENALHAARLLAGEPGRRVLVTSDYHMWRARRVFQKAGIDVVPAPFPDVGKRWNSWPLRWECTWIISVELCKIAYYRMQGWI